MGIEQTYRTLFIEEYIKRKLKDGVALAAEDIVETIVNRLSDTDLSVPQFVASGYHVQEGSESSASHFKETFLSMHQDLRALYKELIALNSVNTDTYERWNVETQNLERRLIDLEERIENLLLLTQDTEGYHSVIIDNFTDATYIDLESTDAEHDLESSTIEMDTASEGTTTSRIFLNDLEESDATFNVRSKANFQNRQDMPESDLTDIFHQSSSTWWTSVNTTKKAPVTCELSVRISKDEPVSLSKIFVETHESTEAGPMFVTPLYSIDNVNWNNLPTTTYSLEVRSTGVFSFPTVKAKYVKFLLNKAGNDPSSSGALFSYQFGFKNIIFYEQSFDIENGSTLITTPMHALNTTGGIKEFEKLTLETCERIEEDTSIDYYITVSNDPDVPLDSDLEPTDGTWIPVTPIQRTNRLHSPILNVGDTIQNIIGDTEQTGSDTEVLGISYDSTVPPVSADNPSPFANPAASFTLLKKNTSTGVVESESRTADSTVRYTFVNSNERILNYQLLEDGTAGLEINRDSIVIFRNIGKRGFTPGDTAAQVRGIQRGWKFINPYYSCVVEIENPEGLSIDVGEKTMIVDGVRRSGLIDNTILTGKSGERGDPDYNDGLHEIKVHKNNWIEVEALSISNDLTELKQKDPLYPFNHKLLIEGYEYPSSYPDTEEKVYTGVDLFAENVMKKVSIFDLTKNIKADNYRVFALDQDAPNSHVEDPDNDPTTVIVIKVNEENPDFKNERFVLRFTQINQLRKYLRLKAVLQTEDETVSPTLHSYKIKLG